MVYVMYTEYTGGIRYVYGVYGGYTECIRRDSGMYTECIRRVYGGIREYTVLRSYLLKPCIR